MVNTMSALLSATTILFLFWTITHLTRKLILKDWSELTTSKLIAIQASGLVGALIYTFSDTFWFSAVEGEVYAYSSAFTAIVFWLILKWEDHADEPHSDRWLVLIMYMTGLSIGVHLLNLLCIPAIVLVYCYRKFPNIETKGCLLYTSIDWHWYEVMYGERYMDTPQTNPEGYKKTSLLYQAKNLKGKLQIIQGLNDVTVVPQHCLTFLKACIAAGTQPDFFVYPGEPHNMRGHQSVHLHDRISQYFDDYLK